MSIWNGYDLKNPPKAGLVITAVSNWVQDCRLQGLLEEAGVRYSLCSGTFDGITEDAFILEWDDWREFVADFAKEDAQELVMLVKPDRCYTVRVQSVCGTGFLVHEHYGVLREYLTEPSGDFTEYEGKYYQATKSLEKQV